jgi:hypothetical protein
MRAHLSKVLAVMLGIALNSGQAGADSAVIARCSRTGMTGQGRAASEGEATSIAINNCLNFGGVPGCCAFITSTDVRDADCIALAQTPDLRHMGIGAGDNKTQAKAKAVSDCGDDHCASVAAICSN